MKNRISPKPGQESVWDYPRPPRLERSTKSIIVEYHDIELANSKRAFRVLETSHPPVYYIPPEDIKMEFLKPHIGGQTFCEWKGQASYWDLFHDSKLVSSIGWSYPNPRVSFALIKDCLAFYPSKVSACYVDGEKVQAQEGDFYGGWITSHIVGPFKGGAGTWGW